MADIVVALVVHRWVNLGESFADVLGEPPALPAVRGWYSRLAARPAFQGAVS